MARSASSNFEAWLHRSDPELSGKVSSAAEDQGVSVTTYVRGAIADFDRLAAEEDWATLTSSLRNSEEPGTICLLAMVHWRLTAPACRAHSRSAKYRTAERAT
jgi:hypothetical protein